VRTQFPHHGDGTEKHLTIEQLAEREQVPVRTVYWWNQTGAGPRRMKIGRNVRYRLADVEQWERTQIVEAV
jgi:predicted DNA-binding transcriptional regulator AlpA